MSNMRMSGCMNLVAKMPQEDQDSLLDRLDKYIADGVPPARAQFMAASDTLAELKAERKEFMGMLREQHPDLFHVPVESKRDEPMFYSELSKQIDKGPNQADSTNWKSYIEGLTKKGVKRDEIEWSGVNEWLDTHKGKITKDQVKQYLDQNGVKIEEKTLQTTGERDQFIDELQAMPMDELREKAYSVDADFNHFDSRAQIVSAIMDTYEGDPMFGRDSDANDTKYDQYTLPGGKNYREVLLKLPEKKEQWNVREKDGRWEVYSDRTSLGTFKTEDMANEEADSQNRTASPIGGYKSTHWDDKNILAHLRLDDRTDADGKKVLMVQEIQSDWGQDGKKKGFVLSSAERAKKSDEIDRLQREIDDIRSSGFRVPTDGTKFEDVDPKFIRIQELISQREELKKVTPYNSIPLAPFVTKTDGWLNLALKRVMKMAVDDGYDKVAFVNGEQSADRYDLSKKVSHIQWNPGYQTGRKLISLEMNEGKELGLTVQDGVVEDSSIGADGKPLDEVLGKEVAKKILDQDSGRLSGLDLKVGGEGMKTFYDQIVPNSTKALLKKLGGKGMESVEFPRWSAEENSDGEWDVYAPNGELETVKPSKEDADEFISKQAVEGPVSQPGFVITPEMRSKVGEGLPLFSKREEDHPELTNAIAKSSMDGKPAAAWRAYLNTLPRRGVPAESIESSGLKDWLADKNGTVSKNDVLSQLAPAPEAQLSKRGITGDTGRKYTKEQLEAFRHVGWEVHEPTLKERMRSLWKDAGKKMAQGLADQFAPVKELSKEAYALLRLSKGAAGAFEALLKGGRLKLTDGVYDFDAKSRGGVIKKLLTPLQGEHHDFLRWVAANRAEQLGGEDKEHLFTDQDIKSIKTLADGDLGFDYTLKNGTRAGQKTRNRMEAYKDSLVTFNEFNKNVMDMAEQSGLIDGESRKYWEHEFYVPFYRVSSEDGGFSGGAVKGGSVRQTAFKQLKGGKDKLKADLLDNTLMNWAHLLDASAKNRAAKATLEAAENAGVAVEANEATAKQVAKAAGAPNPVWFMDGGKKRFFAVDDPYIFAAITSLQDSGMKGPIMNLMAAAKRGLTWGVTSSPFFKVRNLIRDSLQVVGTSPISGNVAGNLVEGWKATKKDSDMFYRLMAGGGTIHFGSMMEGSEAKRVQQLVEEGVDPANILDSHSKVGAFYNKVIKPMFHAYNELGDRGEAINRAALYQQLLKQGVSHQEASLQARDMMDFSMQGSWGAMRTLTQVVPFMNARIQGLYKLGKAAKEDPKRMAFVTGAIALASLGLLAAYNDDDDWKKREDWDRDNYWWFKVGDTAYRIPKPFELGSIATLAERSAELFMNDEMTKERFFGRVLSLLGNNLSMNPIPQLVKPVSDVYANLSSFNGRPIEPPSMDKLDKDQKYTSETSMLARAASTVMMPINPVLQGLLGVDGLSPMQIDYLIGGYFGWLGQMSVKTSDAIARPATDQPSQPTQDLSKELTGGMMSDLEGAQSRYVDSVYQQAQAIEQAHGTFQRLLKDGKKDEAIQYRDDHIDQLKLYGSVEAVKGALAKVNARIHQIELSDMDPDEKRDEIRRLNQRKDQFARKLAPV